MVRRLDLRAQGDYREQLRQGERISGRYYAGIEGARTQGDCRDQLKQGECIYGSW